MPNCFKAQTLAQQSFDAVMRKDKDAWLALFAEDAVVQDPVGVSPLDPAGKGHRGRQEISAFYDNVIAHGTMTLNVKASFPAGDECANLATLHNDIGGMVIENEMIVVYTANDDCLITSLKAYWNFEEMQKKFEK